MEFLISLLALIAVLWLTTIVGAVLAREKNYRFDRLTWYFLVGVGVVGLWLVLCGQLQISFFLSLPLIFGASLWLIQRRGVRFQWNTFKKLDIVVPVVLAFILSSFVFFHRVPEISGKLVLHAAVADDVFWHLAVAKSLLRGFPLDNPVATGEKLFVSPYVIDLFFVGVHQATQISLEALIALVEPVLFVWALSAAAYFLAKRWFGRVGQMVVVALLVGLGLRNFQDNVRLDNFVHYEQSFVGSLQGLSEIASSSRLVVHPSLYDSSIVPALSGLPVYWANEQKSNELGLDTAEYKNQVRQWVRTSGDCPDQSIIVWYANAKEAAEQKRFSDPVRVNICPHRE